MKIGYARKSTHLQDVAHQVDELTKAGCEQIYQDQTSRSGPKRDKKGAPELENCLKALREGDTLVVWALDRLGGSLGQVITLLDDLKKRGITFIAIKDRIDTNAPVIGEIYTHLMAIFSSFERNRNIERTRSGLAAARARGRVGIRPPCRAPEPCGNPPTLPGAGAVWESAHLAGRRCRVGIRPPCRAPVLCGNSPIFMTKICQMTGSCVLIYVRRDFAYQLLRTEIFLNHQYYT
ncbi:TPA: recombinase family protein [Enterobacter hormaechei subsp. xiangfangensis]